MRFVQTDFNWNQAFQYFIAIYGLRRVPEGPPICSRPGIKVMCRTPPDCPINPRSSFGWYIRDGLFSGSPIIMEQPSPWGAFGPLHFCSLGSSWGCFYRGPYLIKSLAVLNCDFKFCFLGILCIQFELHKEERRLINVFSKYKTFWERRGLFIHIFCFV